MKTRYYGYASSLGEMHKRTKLPNQDAYCIKEYSFGTVLAVADGLGSCKHSDVGAKAACKAVCEAVQIFHNHNERDFRKILPLIHSLWDLNISPLQRNECYSTCLFAFITKDRKVFLGQLGDGNIFYKLGDVCGLLKEKEESFCNMTSSLGAISSMKEWRIKLFSCVDAPLKLCLMTDGVSETLIDATKTEFVESVWQEIFKLENLPKRRRMLENILNTWPLESSGDDRTLLAYIDK